MVKKLYLRAMKIHNLGIVFLLWLSLAVAVFAEGVAPTDTVSHQASVAANVASGQSVPDTAVLESPEPDSSNQNITALPDSAYGWKITRDPKLMIASLLFMKDALKHSKTLKDWPIFFVAAPMLTIDNSIERDFLKMFSLKLGVGERLSPVDVGATASINLGLFHLLEFGVSGGLNSAWNYGGDGDFMGAYNPAKADFEGDLFLAEFAYNGQGKASLSIPMMMFLPKSKWTKIVLTAGASMTYHAYTGAPDGTPWTAGMEGGVNGIVEDYRLSLMYLFPFEQLKMAMVTMSYNGYLRSSYFDEIYEDYDPDYKTISINPMLVFALKSQWSAMVMAPIVRERVYDRDVYEAHERYLMKKTGSEWTLKMVMFVLTCKLDI